MATIHEYNRLSPTLARVTCSFASNDIEREMQSVSASLNNCATPVRGSFRKLSGNTYLGFVTATREVRPLDSTKPGTGYRVMAANIYMDETDKSLWEVKNGAGGRYMARQGQEDLSSLLETARVSPTGSVPRLARVLSAAVQPHNIVAYVRSSGATADMDYGACVETGDGFALVVSSFDKQVVKVSNECIVTAVSLSREDMPRIPKTVVQSAMRVRAAKETAADRMDPVLTPVEYWKLAFGHAPEYLSKILKQVEEMGY